MTVTRRAGILMGSVAAVGTLIVLPLSLRHVDFFKLRRVELLGAEYLTAEQVLAAAGLPRDHNIFESTNAIQRRLEAFPGVLTAKVKRRLPATLTILLEERRPVAFVPNEEGRLVPVDAEARPLPYDPTLTGLDLPVLGRADSGLTRTLSLLLATDAELYAEIEGAERGDGDMVILQFEGRQVLWRDVPSIRDIRAVAAVRRRLAADGELFDQLDARFRGAVIVRRRPA